MIKLGVLTSSISRSAGGLYDAVRFLSQALGNSSRVQVNVFGLQDENTSSDLHGWGALQVKAFAVKGFRPYGSAPDLSPALRDAKLDLLHAHGLWQYPSWASLMWSKKNNKPYLISPHGMLDHWALQNARWKKRLVSLLYERAYLQGASCLHALCESEAQAMRDYGLTNPICIIPNGVNLSVNKTTREPDWRKDIPHGSKALLYLGRIHPKKGLINLIKAWGDARRQEVRNADKWSLVIAGWDQGRHTDDLKILAREAGVGDTVLFVGPQYGQDKESAYQNASAFVLPSYSEGLPLVVLEAWSYALPVLMTPQCNIPEGFERKAAIRIETDASSIVEGLRTLFSMDEAELNEIGSKGDALVTDRFTWNTVAENMISIYEWILFGARQPDSVYR